eukprot:FR734599.1.p1 GENE.FR734599.1~~FR734599.1.p1  ORF type:complete len:131 (+),score=14.53 FR734599.1:195-587(+)
MGPTAFIKGTHKQTAARLMFDKGVDNGERDKMLSEAKAEYALLKAGDAVVFDMRTLHAGNSNLLDGGSTRYFLCITFRNPEANDVELAHVPCIRAGFKDRLTLSEVRRELGKKQGGFSLAEFGSGLSAAT